MSPETQEISEFWELLVSSQLVSPSVLQQQAALIRKANTAKELAGTLVSKKLITDYQAKILLSGASGPFHFGNYSLSSRYDQGGLDGQFKARHRGTQHPVRLEFLAGASAEDLLRWQHIERVAERLSTNESPFLVAVYETVVMPQYRFVVSQRPTGISLAELLPGQNRMDWKPTCGIFAQVAFGLRDLHQTEIEHRSVCPNEIWISKTKQTQLRVDLNVARFIETEGAFIDLGHPHVPENEDFNRFFGAPKKSSDFFSLGCCLGKAIRGKPIVDNDLDPESRAELIRRRLADLKQMNVPQPLIQLIKDLIATEGATDSRDFDKIGRQLASFGGIAEENFKAVYPATKNAYLQSIAYLSEPTERVDSFPKLLDEGTVSSPWVGTDTDIRIEHSVPATSGWPKSFDQSSRVPNSDHSSAKGGIRYWSKKHNSVWGTMAASLGIFFVFVGGILYFAANQEGPMIGQRSAETDPRLETLNRTNDESIKSDPLNVIADLPEAYRPTIQQTLIKDDQQTLWQSPTEGLPLQLAELPLDPRLIFDFRLADLMQREEGERLINSLGPELLLMIKNWESVSGVTLTDLSRLTLSLHSSDTLRYQTFFICELAEPRSLEEIRIGWQQPQARESTSGSRFFQTDDQQWAFMIISNSELVQNAQTDQDNETIDEVIINNANLVRKFAMGPPELIVQFANFKGKNPLTGVLRRIAERSDRERHFNFLFLRQALFNDEGIDLMGQNLLQLNRQLNVLLPDSMQAGLISCHLDEGTYLELQFIGSSEIRAVDLQAQLTNGLREKRNQLTEYVLDLPSNRYWDRLRSRIGLMLVDLFRSLRWGVEHGEVVSNAWLPPMASHNLMAAAELGISFSGGTAVGPMVPSSQPSPKTLDQLLEIKRDLEIANPPDLNLLLRDLQHEIVEQYPELPFKFQIRLMGGDLQLEGITQNQRPGELKLKQKTLAEILTYIMTSANPVRDISGPSDPLCKLVWVIVEDLDEAGERTILVTTRNAAERNGYILPKAFQTQENP